MPKVFVSIINFNGEKDTLMCLDSLDNLSIKNFELNVVVVDNASKKIFKTDRKYNNFKLETVRNEENLGFSGGQNLGIKYALAHSADYVLVLNNDVVLDKNLIAELLDTFQKQEKCGIVSPKIYFAKGYEYHKDRYSKEDLGKVIWYAGGEMDWKNVIAFHLGVDEVDKGQFEEEKQITFASGCCMLIKKDVFNSVGFFDEKYFLYYEDNDLSQRAKRAGFEIYFQPKAFLWHLNAGSAGGSGSSLQDYYITRNRLIFGMKYTPPRTKLALVRESIKLFFAGRKSQKLGVKDYYLHNFGLGGYK
jgi:GT2 family glycosyltransferase